MEEYSRGRQQRAGDVVVGNKRMMSKKQEGKKLLRKLCMTVKEKAGN